MSEIAFWLIIVGLAIVSGLAFYAGRLLFLLKQQKHNAEQVRQQRISNILDSVHTIAQAMQQQQCNLSEGSIRLGYLLKAMPLRDPCDFQAQYPALFELFDLVKDLPTHEARKALKRQQREQQDELREAHEARLESAILKEVTQLQTLSF